MKKHALVLLALIFLSHYVFSQGGVGINASNNPPHATAMLDVSSDTSGVLIPRMTRAQRNDIVNPAGGLIICQIDNSPGFYYYNGINWVPIGINVLGVDDLTDGRKGNTSLYLGTGSGILNTGTDLENTAFGNNTLAWNQDGKFNTALGYRALNESTDDYNTAVGCEALGELNSGISNTVVGSQSFWALNHGSYNTAVGHVAGYLIDGDRNTFVGYATAGRSPVHDLSDCVFIGHRAGYFEDNDNRLYIENTDSSTPLIWGDFANDIVRINGTFDIADEYSFPDTVGDSAMILELDGMGKLVWGEKDEMPMPRYSVGDWAQGGVIFWLDHSGEHGLACSKENQSESIRWYAGTNGITRAQGNGPFAGEMNTVIIISSSIPIGDDGSNFAANLCSKIMISQGGKNYGDWYLPSKRELKIMHNNMAIIDATALANGGSAFETGYYWSSTEAYADSAHIHNFPSGLQDIFPKHMEYRVRAIRAF